MVPRELCPPSSSSSCVVSPHANLKFTSPTTPAQVPPWGELRLWACYSVHIVYNVSMLCMVPRELCSLAAVVQHQHDSLGSCVRAPATASTPSIMPARVHGPSGVVSPSCVVSPTLIYKVHVVRHDSSLPREFAGNGNG